MKTNVVHHKKKPYDVYIGRDHNNPDQHWGNPFVIPIHGDRDVVISQFEKWIKGELCEDLEPKRREWILDNIHNLKGKILGCWCAPKACHGDILAKMADQT